MTSVRAFQPRKSDPPHFVAYSQDEIEDKVGEFIGGDQCDRCGNHSYRIEKRHTSPSDFARFSAVCAVDPDDAEEFHHPAPCGQGYPIGIWDEDQVVF